MVSTRAQASAPERATAQNPQGDAPNPCTGIENHPDPAVRGLAAKMDEMSKAFIALCTRMDKKEKGAPSRGSQAEISRSRGGRHERRDGAPSHRDLPRTEVASSGRAPRGPEERRGPRSQGGQEHRAREMAEAPRSPQRSRRTPERRVHQQPDELRHFLNAKKATAPPPVEEKLEKVWNRVFGESSGASIPQSPFTTDVRARALPSKFKMPNLEAYDGSADPMDHLNMFREHLSLQGLDETAMCQCFPLTLKGDARVWFYGMPAGSISTFGELATAFLSQFASSRRVEKQPWHLTRIKQGAREILRGFLARFVSEAR